MISRDARRLRRTPLNYCSLCLRRRSTSAPEKFSTPSRHDGGRAGLPCRHPPPIIAPAPTRYVGSDTSHRLSCMWFRPCTGRPHCARAKLPSRGESGSNKRQRARASQGGGGVQCQLPGRPATAGSVGRLGSRGGRSLWAVRRRCL